MLQHFEGPEKLKYVLSSKYRDGGIVGGVEGRTLGFGRSENGGGSAGALHYH